MPRPLGPALAAACDGGPGGKEAGLQIEVAPLELEGVVDVCYTITVRNGPLAQGLPTGDTVWSESVCSSQYGNGAGDVTYIGTCDAQGANGKNSVELTLDELWVPGRRLDEGDEFQNPCTGSGETRCILLADCVRNSDTLVRFDLTVLRDADQGFFDIAVRFEDLFCSAKVDCRYEGGEAIELPATGPGTVEVVTPGAN